MELTKLIKANKTTELSIIERLDLIIGDYIVNQSETRKLKDYCNLLFKEYCESKDIDQIRNLIFGNSFYSTFQSVETDKTKTVEFKIDLIKFIEHLYVELMLR